MHIGTAMPPVLAGLFPLSLMLFLVGCAAPPPDQSGKLTIPVPQVYSVNTNISPFSNQGWLTDFKAPHLKALVEEALSHNYDLQAAAARLDAAGATRRIAASARYPQISASTGASRRRAVFDTASGDTETEWFNTYNLGLSLLWEIDLWGKLKNRTQASMADLQAAQADYHAVELSLAVNTVKAWFNAIEAQQQLQLARDTLSSFENNLAVVDRGFKRGITRALDVRLIRGNVATARSNLELRKRLRDAAGRSLEVILGRYPADEIEVARELPEVTAPVPPGLPSGLLKRRPDLVAAERRFAASVERLKASKKELLPSISLSGGGNTSSAQLEDLLDYDRLAATVAANLAQPIFQGGRLVAGIKLADANSRQALALYAQDVLLAFREVETFLAADAYLRLEELALRDFAAESTAAEELAWQQYQRGLADIATVLESQRRAFNSRSSLINVMNDRLQNRLNLYLALGGDFAPFPAPNIVQTQP